MNTDQQSNTPRTAAAPTASEPPFLVTFDRNGFWIASRGGGDPTHLTVTPLHKLTDRQWKALLEW